MAKLSAHGTEIGRLYRTTSVVAYFADGKVLKNAGFGWKLHAKIKEGHDIHAAFEKAKANQDSFLSMRPALAEYRKELRAICGITKAWKLHAAIQMMPTDADGVWSEACDGYGDNCSADVDEIGKLCDLYLEACAENRRLNPEKYQAMAA